MLSWMGKGKVIVLYGARQVGKTTLLRGLLDRAGPDSLYLNGDEPDVRVLLEGRSSTELKAVVGKRKLVGIDEAQRIRDIGLALKLMADTLHDVQIIATGSSSFELANKVVEPLTGRKIEFHLHPFSLEEMRAVEEPAETRRLLERRMVFGMYPDVILSGGEDAGRILRELCGSYLYKDVLAWNAVRKADVLEKLLRALALQVGNEVSYTEIGGLLGIDKITVETYVKLLEQAFVIFRLEPFSRNLRNELKRLRKIYFWDTGIRNALINNLNPLELRADVGALWENFMIVERIKHLDNADRPANKYFWRTHQQQEIDWIEEAGGGLSAAEFKWREAPRWRVPPAFAGAYPDARARQVHRGNFEEFLFGKEA